jgi:hypothetical protein
MLAHKRAATGGPVGARAFGSSPGGLVGPVPVGLADDDWIDLPEPIATLLRSYLVDGWNTRTAAKRRHHWLFPGGMPGQHLHIHRASDALRTAGIPVLAARNSTWLQLVREAPPAVLARTLGISPRTAMQHATRAGTDYQAYAAERAREEQN